MINLNGYKEKIILSKENVLSNIDSYNIFKHYIEGNFVIGKNFSSPLRKDRHPSFTLYYSSKNRELFWKDFREGGGDAIVFVQRMFNLNYYEALSKIAIDFNIKDLFVGVKDVFKSDKKIIIYNEIDQEQITTIVKIKSRPFNQMDHRYWSQFGITKKCLKRYNVTPITHFFINDRTIKASKIAYAYPEVKDYKVTYKIYQPYDIKTKWFNNHNYSVIQGWRQLPDKNDILIITSSLKDAMSIVSTTGYDSIAPQAESVLLKSNIIEDLSNRFNEIYLFYDNDYMKDENWGQINAKKTVAKYENLKNILIPSEYHSKDYSDLVLNKGSDIASSLLKNIISGRN